MSPEETFMDCTLSAKGVLVPTSFAAESVAYLPCNVQGKFIHRSESGYPKVPASLRLSDAWVKCAAEQEFPPMLAWSCQEIEVCFIIANCTF